MVCDCSILYLASAFGNVDQIYYPEISGFTHQNESEYQINLFVILVHVHGPLEGITSAVVTIHMVVAPRGPL